MICWFHHSLGMIGHNLGRMRGANVPYTSASAMVTRARGAKAPCQTHALGWSRAVSGREFAVCGTQIIMNLKANVL